MNEIRKDIVGFEGEYMVSNMGNVKSLDRKVYKEYRKRNGEVYMGHQYQNQYSTGGNEIYGYDTGLTKSLMQTRFLAYIGHNPNTTILNGYIVRHINKMNYEETRGIIFDDLFMECKCNDCQERLWRVEDRLKEGAKGYRYVKLYGTKESKENIEGVWKTFYTLVENTFYNY